MRHTLYLAMTILFLPWGYASEDAGRDPDANAALKYWQAFATLPNFTAAEKEKINAEDLTKPLDVQARKLVARSGHALRMMHRAAALPRCDWAIGWEDEGLENRLPHLESARLLSSLACLSARMQFEDGQSAAAIDDLLAAMTLGRHVSVDGSLVAILADFSMEGRTSETLALYLPKLNAEIIKDFRRRFDTLPPSGTLATGVREEQILETGCFVRQVKGAKDKDSLLALLSWLCGSAEKGRGLLEDCGGTQAGVLKFTEELRSSYPRLAKRLDLPLDQFEKEQEREAMKLAANPMYQIFVPAIIRCRWLQAEADVRRALLSAALAVQLDGQGALKPYSDPVVGGPLEYVAFDGGFELRSRWKVDDQSRSKWKLGAEFARPVTLTVGRHGK
jgi:hypothetical protein